MPRTGLTFTINREQLRGYSESLVSTTPAACGKTAVSAAIPPQVYGTTTAALRRVR